MKATSKEISEKYVCEENICTVHLQFINLTVNATTHKRVQVYW